MSLQLKRRVLLALAWIETTVSVTGAILVSALFVQACPQRVPPNVPPDATDASSLSTASDGPLDDDSPPPSPELQDCQTACGRLEAAGCQEGMVADCAHVVCQINQTATMVHINTACLATAVDAAAVRACGATCTQ